MRRIVIPLLLSVAACQSGGRAPLPLAAPPSSLVGVWGLEAEACESDNALAFTGDGTWSAYRSNGRWQLKGATLTMQTIGIEDDSGSDSPVTAPDARQQVSFPARDRLVMTGPDGKTTRLKRCR